MCSKVNEYPGLLLQVMLNLLISLVLGMVGTQGEFSQLPPEGKANRAMGAPTGMAEGLCNVNASCRTSAVSPYPLLLLFCITSERCFSIETPGPAVRVKVMG